ncbi:VanZ family protein [Virgibacillus proomii]|uniref:VanZ family protein n=1 Tax=Virgibacillus proomii TaxID=84407 RepID=UPI001C120A29|nr:VanZ family protein [Virgibacillus proomii]MBU5266132.1 VanZ family protein [Virgibacillus proomii]
MFWITDIFLYILLPGIAIYALFRLLLMYKYKLNLRSEIRNLTIYLYLLGFTFIVWLTPAPDFGYLPINLVPFKTIMELFSNDLSFYIIASNLFGNIILTLPIGIFIVYKWKQIKFLNLLCIGLAVPIMIESIQYILYYIGYGSRSIDIDDVILNMTGILIGYYLSRWAFHLYQMKKNSKQPINSAMKGRG